MTYVEGHPESEQAGLHVAVVIPKAALIGGGLAMQREMTLAAQAHANLQALAEAAIANLEAKVRECMEAALAHQNARRVAVGLPPLVPMEGQEPVKAPLPTITPRAMPAGEGEAKAPGKPGSPYRGRRPRVEGATA